MTESTEPAEPAEPSEPVEPSEPIAAPPRPVRVVLVDDHRMFRSGVRTELGDAVEVVGEAEDVDGAVAVITATVPDVVLLDVHLPGGGGRAILQALVPALPDVRFLALSVSDTPGDVIELVHAGARGRTPPGRTGPRAPPRRRSRARGRARRR